MRICSVAIALAAPQFRICDDISLAGIHPHFRFANTKHLSVARIRFSEAGAVFAGLIANATCFVETPNSLAFLSYNRYSRSIFAGTVRLTVVSKSTTLARALSTGLFRAPAVELYRRNYDTFLNSFPLQRRHDTNVVQTRHQI